MTEQIIDALRLVNAGLAIATLAALYVRINEDWSELGRSLRQVGRLLPAGQAVLLLATALGSASALFNDAPPNPAVPLVTIACLLILTGLWRTRSDRRRSS